MTEFNPAKIEKYAIRVQKNQFKQGADSVPVNDFTTNAILSFFDKNKDGNISVNEFKNVSKESYSLFSKQLKEYNSSQKNNQHIHSYDELQAFLDDGYADYKDLSFKANEYLDKEKLWTEKKGQKAVADMTEKEILAEFDTYETDKNRNPNIINSIRKERNNFDENSDIVDWHIGTYNQGMLQTCTILAAAEALSEDNLRNIYTKKQDKNGNVYYEVNFPSDRGRKPVKVTQEEINNMSIKKGRKEIVGFSTGDKDVLLLEMAYIKRYGTNILKNGENAVNIISRMYNKNANFYSNITEELLNKQDIPKIISLLDLQTLRTEKNITKGEIELSSGKKAKLYMSNEDPTNIDNEILKLPSGSIIYKNHAYIVKGYNPKTQEVTVSSSHENSTDIIIPFELMKLFGISL